MKYLPADYGRCPCSGVYENRIVEVRMTVGGEAVVLENVPQGACPICSSRVYKTVVLERLEALLHQPEAGPQEDPAK